MSKVRVFADAPRRRRPTTRLASPLAPLPRPTGRHTSAELELWAGDFDAARRIVAAALAHVETTQVAFYTAPLVALGVRAEADRARRSKARQGTGEVAEAEAVACALTDRLDSQLAAFTAGSPPPESTAYRAQVDAELARLRGAPDAAAWSAARERWEHLAYPFHAAYCGWREVAALLESDCDRSRLEPPVARGARYGV
jgi:hypothetical protein